jgi:hypothetical protein
MSRQRPPNRRQCETFEFTHAGLDFTLCAGFYPDGRIAEIFLSSRKPGSPIGHCPRCGGDGVDRASIRRGSRNNQASAHQRP